MSEKLSVFNPEESRVLSTTVKCYLEQPADPSPHAAKHIAYHDLSATRVFYPTPLTDQTASIVFKPTAQQLQSQDLASGA